MYESVQAVYGYIKLNGYSDYSGVTVRISADGYSDLITKTSSSGYFSIGNVSASEEHRVTFEKEGWEILRDTDYAGNLYYYDSQRDGFMVAFKALGYSMNTENEDEINAAYEWLREMNQTMSPSFVTDEVHVRLASAFTGDHSYS